VGMRREFMFGGIIVRPRKRTILILLILLLLAVAVTINFYYGDNMFSKETSLSEFIEQGKLRELTLTIYYVSPNILTLIPLSVDGLITWEDAYKAVINGIQLEDHIDQLRKISNADLMPVENKSYVNARLYYVFETKTHRKVYDVCMWGAGNSIFVNGIEVQSNDIFYDVVKPFLPEDAVTKLENYLTKGFAQ
jgi:hypothetical protein